MTTPDLHLTKPVKSPYLTDSHYYDLYARSLRDPKNFWSEQADNFITWFKRWDEVFSGDFAKWDVRWFRNGKLNAAYNCIDRHLEKRSKQVAILWEGDHPNESQKITYAELYDQVCRLANVLKKQGIKKGDRVCIYLPMIPEAVISMLACARIGAVHSVIFAGFSPEALKTRIIDADCRLVITANEGCRANKKIPLKKNVDEALLDCPRVRTVLVVERTKNSTPMTKERDLWYHELMRGAAPNCPCEMSDSEDPFFILYTSGSTGTPKGILHTLGGYMVYVAITFKYVFNFHEGDIYWCTADVGWITGHSYLVYGPLSQGATIVLYEGVPHFPNPSRYWEIIDKYKVNIFYTAPTAIRGLRHEGDEWVNKTNRHSLKLLGSVGEPINPDVWEWYFNTVGDKRCPIVDTWWQTETGGILITPLAGVTPQKPGSAGRPFFGIIPEILNEKGENVPTDQMGQLVIKQPWPGMMQTIYGNRERFQNTYFKLFPGYYLTGDDAKKDSDGDFWITGRNDDVIKIAGHRIGTGEVESALLTHPSVSEAGVTTIPDQIKGQSIYAFVTLKPGIKATTTLKKELVQQVRKIIGPIVLLKNIQFTQQIPKTRSGKIMRRLLRKIANNDFNDLGDTSTLADESVVEKLIEGRKKIKLEKE